MQKPPLYSYSHRLRITNIGLMQNETNIWNQSKSLLKKTKPGTNTTKPKRKHPTLEHKRIPKKSQNEPNYFRHKTCHKWVNQSIFCKLTPVLGNTEHLPRWVGSMFCHQRARQAFITCRIVHSRLNQSKFCKLSRSRGKTKFISGQRQLGTRTQS